jgi:hypothetical protein
LPRRMLDAAEDVLPDYGRPLFLISPPECCDELRMLPNGFLVRPTGLSAWSRVSLKTLRTS